MSDSGHGGAARWVLIHGKSAVHHGMRESLPQSDLALSVRCHASAIEEAASPSLLSPGQLMYEKKSRYTTKSQRIRASLYAGGSKGPKLPCRLRPPFRLIGRTCTPARPRARVLPGSTPGPRGPLDLQLVTGTELRAGNACNLKNARAARPGGWARPIAQPGRLRRHPRPRRCQPEPECAGGRRRRHRPEAEGLAVTVSEGFGPFGTGQSRGQRRAPRRCVDSERTGVTHWQDRHDAAAASMGVTESRCV